MTYLIHIHIVSYAGAAHTLPAAVTAARRAWPTAPITVLDDARDPVPPSVRREMSAAPGIEYRSTRWPRGGNLRGRVCLRGLLAEYRRSLRRSWAAYALKLDADTLVLDPSQIVGLMMHGIDYAAHSTLDGPYGGGCILLSAAAVRVLTHAVRHADLPPTAREDLTLGGLALASSRLAVASLDGCTPVTADGPHVYYASADTREAANADYVARLATKAAVVNVGTAKITGADRATEAHMADALLAARYTLTQPATTTTTT